MVVSCQSAIRGENAIWFFTVGSSGVIADMFIAVVDFVPVKAPRSHKDQKRLYADAKHINQKHLEPLNFNKFP
jgi:hypothetical protein